MLRVVMFIKLMNTNKHTKSAFVFARLFRSVWVVLALLNLTACQDLFGNGSDGKTLSEARAGHSDQLTQHIRQNDPAATPPKNVLQLVRYPAPKGETSGYLTPRPKGDGKYPAIVWISGGDQAIGDFWSPRPRDNDQTAAAFREAGLVVFYPSMRGLNNNPGTMEGYYGELDDVVAATKWLKSQPFVDSNQVYLGGHSTGGTLVLLASEYAKEWAGVFSFGPRAEPSHSFSIVKLPIGITDTKGHRLRSPKYWLDGISQPTYIIEGAVEANSDDLEEMQKITKNPLVNFSLVPGCDHFSVLRPASEIIAQSIQKNNLAALNVGVAFAALCD